MKKSLVAFKNGRKLEPVSSADWNRTMDAFDDGIKVTVTIEHFKRKRSLSQNSYLHFIIKMIADETGEDPEALKRAFKARFGIVEEVTDKNNNILFDDNAEPLYNIKSTADYTTDEMSKFVDKIRMWALDFIGLKTPDPDVYRNYNIGI